MAENDKAVGLFAALLAAKQERNKLASQHEAAVNETVRLYHEHTDLETYNRAREESNTIVHELRRIEEVLSRVERDFYEEMDRKGIHVRLRYI